MVLGLVGIFWFALHPYVVKDGQRLIGSLPGVIISVVVFATSFVIGTSAGNILSLQTKRNSSFFAKNREYFAQHTVATVITVVVTFLLGLFLGRLMK